MLLRSVLLLLVTANVYPSPPILVTLMMEAIRSSETSVRTSSTRLDIPENGILHLIVINPTKSWSSWWSPSLWHSHQ
jgi:hypothetical protein